jgi:hypothetical protein
MGAKELSNWAYDTFKEDGYFENNFLDESKFKVRLYNAIVSTNILSNSDDIPSAVMGVAYAVSKDIVRENVDSTLEGLLSKGLISKVLTEGGDDAYILNEIITNK